MTRNEKILAVIIAAQAVAMGIISYKVFWMGFKTAMALFTSLGCAI